GAPPTPAVNLAVRRASESAPTAEPPRLGMAAPTAAPVAPPTPAAELARSEDITRAAPVPSPATRIGERHGGARRGCGVQVTARRDEATANGVVRGLEERGYNAYVVRAGLQGDTWYRVRVGRFPTMEAATAVVVRLKNEERYARAFLVND